MTKDVPVRAHERRNPKVPASKTYSEAKAAYDMATRAAYRRYNETVEELQAKRAAERLAGHIEGKAYQEFALREKALEPARKKRNKAVRIAWAEYEDWKNYDEAQRRRHESER